MTSDQQIRELTVAAAQIVNRIDDLTGGTHDQVLALAKTQEHNRRMIFILWAGFFLDIALTLAVSFGFFAINNTTEQLQEVRTVDRRDALCPLYQQFLNADTPKARALAKANGQDMEKRAHAFQVIRAGYNALNCFEFEKE